MYRGVGGKKVGSGYRGGGRVDIDGCKEEDAERMLGELRCVSFLP